MILKFWGVRGTFPVSDEDKVYFGGYTPCASIISRKKEVIIVDAGTGIRNLGQRLMENNRNEEMVIHLLLTHFHLDHILGFPYFGALYSRRTILNIYSPYGIKETQRFLEGMMRSRYFPLDFKDTPAEKNIKQIPSEGIEVGGIRITFCPLNHPQESFAYRLEEGGTKLVFATDTEHPEKGIDRRLVNFSTEADILIYDSTFTPEEYEAGKKGWGHSTWAEGVKIGREAGVRALFLSHYNPEHSDEKVKELILKAKSHFPSTHGARQGEELRLMKKRRRKDV